MPDTHAAVDQQYSAALRGVLKRMNKESDNFFAEMLLKGLGKDFYGDGQHRGRHRGRARMPCTRWASRPAPTSIQDGSGLSYGDRLTAEGVVKVLGAMRQREDFDDYYDSLAIAGKDGTLHDRMRGTAAAGNAHAKTGTLNIAVCLSGYVTSANDHLVAFSILMNGGSVGTSDWERATDGAGQDRRGPRQGLTAGRAGAGGDAGAPPALRLSRRDGSRRWRPPPARRPAIARRRRRRPPSAPPPRRGSPGTG